MCYEKRDPEQARVCFERDQRKDDYISRKALLAEYDRAHVGHPGGARKLIEEAPAADVLPVNREEMRHLMNDTISYIWGMEDRGATAPEFGYDSRKALLAKLKEFYKEHFPEPGECAG